MSLLTPDFGLLFWMLLSFAIVFGLLAKYSFPVITRQVDERREYIRQSLDAADEANRKLAAIKDETDAMLSAARVRQTELMKEAAAEGEKIVQAAKDRAAAEARKLMDEAGQRIDAQRLKAADDLRREAARLSVDMAEKIIRRQLGNADSQEALVSRLLDEVERDESSSQI